MGSPLTALVNRLRRDVRGHVRTDSRQVRPGDAFIAWPGAAVDGRRFVAQALAEGATLALVEAEGVAAFAFQDERVLPVAQLKALTGPLLAEYLGQPSQRVDVVAITGTNGKTSCAWWLSQLLSDLGEPAGLMGTLGIGLPALPNQSAQIKATGLTTPDPLTLQTGLRAFADQGLKVCALEASSIGIEEHRLAGCRVAVAVFTNFTQDHLDYHGSMDAYWQSKARLFQWPGLQAAVLYTGDPKGGELLQSLRDRSGLALWTYGVGAAHVGANHLQAVDLRSTASGQAFTVVETDGAGRVCDRIALEVPLVGEYNAMNLLAVLAVARARGHSLAAAVAACGRLSPVPGRMERAADADPLVLVDYAHTPDALDKALQALRPLAQARQGQLWVVVGCGGDRDPIKRPLMAAAAERHADRCVFTSDNPRSEDPVTILAHMCAGVQRPDAVRIEPDRATAIADAVRQAQPADVVLIAGKGHEDYQEVAGVRRPFNDREHASQALRARPMYGLLDLLSQLSGARVLGQCTQPVLRVHTDTRTLAAGDLFVALRGERFDAHDFVPQARAQGAVAALAERGLAEAGLPGVEVPDSRVALGELAGLWRQRYRGPLIAVTGSNGKTTVTQMVASILRAAQPEHTHATQGNLNNDIGVPLTLLRLRDHHRLSVVELGMNHPGEIAGLAATVLPTVALVNNAQREHQEFMGTVEAVARENGAVLQALSSDGVAVFPSDDAHTPVWQALAVGRRVMTFSDSDTQADVLAVSAEWREGHWRVVWRAEGQHHETRLHIAGRHNVRNAMAAAACALAAGVPARAVNAGLDAFEPVGGRSRALSLRWPSGHTMGVVDDTYNANPDSVRAAIDVLAELPGPRWLALGDMGEVGDQGLAFHLEVLRHARARGIDAVHVSGDWMRQACDALRAAGEPLPTLWDEVDALARHWVANMQQAHTAPASALVKGSRFMRMERVVQALQASVATDNKESTDAA